MSIATEITRLQSAKSDLKTAINAKLSTGLIDDEKIDEYADFVDNIQTGGGFQYIIQAAELPNITLGLYDNNNTLIENKTTGTNGGMVEFEIADAGIYVVKATDSSSTLIWSQTITLDEIGVYSCKTAKALDDYTWSEIQTASNGGYAKYMWSVGDYKDLSSFLGETTSTYTRAVILGFDHDDKADGTGKAGITFKLPNSSSTYRHWTVNSTNINGISWVGSLIRSNCLKSGEYQYVYDPAITSSSSGTYYTINIDNETFSEVILPDDYVSGTKYYSRTQASTDGAFITGLPSDLSTVIKQVEKETWGGYGLTDGKSDNTIIKTKDWLFILSDSEVFGESNRYVNYSKNTLEGHQYDYFKKYEENRFRQSAFAWLRSPGLSGSGIFCCWYHYGYVINSYASGNNSVALCFCI